MQESYSAMAFELKQECMHIKEDSMTSDVPSEARLNPSQWGLFSILDNKTTGALSCTIFQVIYVRVAAREVHICPIGRSGEKRCFIAQQKNNKVLRLR